MKGQTSQEELDKFEEALLKYGSLSPGGAEHLIEVAQRLFKENQELRKDAIELAEFYEEPLYGQRAIAFLKKWRRDDG